MQVSSIFAIISVCLAVGIRSNATASVSVECVCVGGGGGGRGNHWQAVEMYSVALYYLMQ